MIKTWTRLSSWLAVCWVACALLPAPAPATEEDNCAVCGRPLVDEYYNIEDKVTLEKKHVCKDCERSFAECFVCGLPANTNAADFVLLPDQRVLCGRDAKTAVLTENDGDRICLEVKEGLDRLFSRFTSFPEKNVTFSVIDRVSLQNLFRLAGNDYHCPNVWGLTETLTNQTHLEYRISLMTGLPLTWFKATCAHEYGHTWISEHLSNARKAVLGRDAEEGFCELLSFLFMDSLNEQAQKSLILRNAYTRGQINLFIAAEQLYGINEVMDWMKLGADAELSASQPDRIRRLGPYTLTRKPAFAGTAVVRTGPAAPAELVLKGINWHNKHPLAIINGHTFAPNEQAKIPLGTTNIVVRCLAIFPDEVRLRVEGRAQEQVLRLDAN